MINPDEIDHLTKLLEVLRNGGVQRCVIGDMSFELGPAYRSAMPMPVSDLRPNESMDERAIRQRKDLEELLFASSGG